MLSNVSDQNPVEQVAEAVQVAPTDQELSLVAVENEHAVTTSLRVAEVFGKQHKNVVRDIRSLDCSEEFRKLNFEPSKIAYQNGNIKKQLPMYYITRDGFMFLVMGFTGKTAAKWKEAYIKAFNEMEAKIRAEQMAKAIEEHDRKEAEEYEKLLEREAREEAEVDRRVKEYARQRTEEAKAKAEPQTTEQQTTTAEDGIIIEDYNGRRVVSSLTLAKLQGREHRYVCESIQRMKKYFVRPGSVIFRCGRTVNRGFGKGYESPTGVVYYITAEAFKVMCKHCTTIDKDMQSEVRKAFRRAQGPKNHGKPVATTQAPQQTKPKAPTTPPTPTETAKPQQGKPTAAMMPQTPTDLMQRFVKAVGVMMGMDTDNLMNLMNKGE